MILRFDRKAFNLLAFIFLYTSSPRLALGKQNTPFVATRQARSKAEKYIVAIRDKGSKSFFSFSGLAEIKYEGLLAELSNRQGIKAFDHFYTFEKKVAKSFHKLWGTLKQRVHLFELTLEEGQKNRSVLQNLQSNPQVLFIEEDIFYKIDTHINERSQILLQKEQEFFGNWWQEQIKLPEAIALLKGRMQENNKSLIRPIIAILDTGIDSSHSLLGDESLWKNPNPGSLQCGQDLHGCATNAFVEEGLGTPQTFPLGTTRLGEACLGSGELKNACEHGTQVASVLSAYSPKEGALGVCPLCLIMILKVMSFNEGKVGVYTSSVLRALKYIALANSRGEDPVRILNLSFGGYSKSQAMGMFLHHLRMEYNILVVASAGNESTDQEHFPSSFSHVLSVGALNADGEIASYSNYGEGVDLLAPGGSYYHGVMVASPGESYDWAYGTSIASPVVAGAAGLLLSLEPNLRVEQLEEVLLKSDVKNKEKDKVILNLEASIKNVLSKKYKLKTSEKQERVQPFCGQIIALSPATRFHLKSLSIWFIIFSPILIILFLQPYEVKLWRKLVP